VLAFFVDRLRPGHAKATAAIIDIWLNTVRQRLGGDAALQVAAHCAAIESRGLAELVAFCGPEPDDAMRAAIGAAAKDVKRSIAALRHQATVPSRPLRSDAFF
jgi:hypothetical protein